MTQMLQDMYFHTKRYINLSETLDEACVHHWIQDGFSERISIQLTLTN